MPSLLIENIRRRGEKRPLLMGVALVTDLGYF